MPILIALILAVAMFVDSILNYIMARIILPAIGLHAPHYAAVFWVTFFATISAMLAYSLKRWLE